MQKNDFSPIRPFPGSPLQPSDLSLLMSYRKHPTKNRGLPAGWKGPTWWQLEVWPEGKKRVAGKIVSSRLQPLFHGTETQVKIFHADLHKQSMQVTGLPAYPRLDKTIPLFLADYKTIVEPGTVADFMVSYSHLEKHFGPHRLVHINNTLVQQYKNMRLEEKYLPGRPKQPAVDDTPEDAARRKPPAKKTINKELSYLNSVLRWAEEQDPPLIEPGSFRAKLFPKRQIKKTPILPHTFAEAVLLTETIGARTYKDKNCNTGLHQQMAKDRYLIVLLMYTAGLRKTEALKIEAGRVNIPPEPTIIDGEPQYGTINVTRKGGRIQTLPILTEWLYTELLARVKKTTGYLITNPKTKRPYIDIRDGIKSAGKLAGIDKKNNPHLFRHDYVTHLHESGCDMKTIQELVGHADISTTANIYSHLTTNALRTRAKEFTTRIAGLRTRAEPKQAE